MPQERRTPGRLEVISGCMFAGKTAALIDRLSAARASGRRVIAFKHVIDDRYDATHLVTHDGRRFDAMPAPDAAAVLERAAEADVVAVDEGHFFGRPLVAACEALLARGARVIVVGLTNDAWGRPFPPFPELAALATEVIELRAPCRVCGRPAPYSQRMVPVTDEFMVGGLDEYEPRCREHFESLPPPAPPY
jgi:thymidine kinase